MLARKLFSFRRQNFFEAWAKICERDLISDEILSTGVFYEQDLTGVSAATVTLNGNPNDGFQCNVTN